VTRLIWLVLAVGLLMGSDNEDPTKKEYARFDGVWRFALVEVEGTKQPEAPFETNKINLLTICRTAPDHARPTEFASKPGSGQTLMTYKREKASTTK